MFDKIRHGFLVLYSMLMCKTIMVGLMQKGSSKEVTLCQKKTKIIALQIEKNEEGCKHG